LISIFVKSGSRQRRIAGRSIAGRMGHPLLASPLCRPIVLLARGQALAQEEATAHRLRGPENDGVPERQ